MRRQRDRTAGSRFRVPAVRFVSPAAACRHPAARHHRVIAVLAVCGVLGVQDLPAQIGRDPVAAAIKTADYAIDRIVGLDATDRTFGNTVGAIDDVIVRLRLATEFLQFMAYVSPNAELRDAGQRAEETVRNWMIALNQRQDLFAAVRSYADSNPELEGEQARLLGHTLRDFRRAGMDLDDDKRAQLREVREELTRLSLEFQRNIREDETRVMLAEDELSGMPDDYLRGQQQADGIYMIGLDYPSFLPLMDYCDVESTRKKAWLAYKRRGGRRNVKLIEKIITLRARAARLLGYRHTADFETEIRMSRSASEVQKFYRNLRPLIRRKALQDFEELNQAKCEHTGDGDAKLYPWDQSFYEKRLLREKYSVDSRRVREYFPLDKVLQGLFSITQSLYGLAYREVTDEAEQRGFTLWHPDVRLYEVTDTRLDKSIGQFFLDLHPREDKFGHAAQWGLFPRKRWSDGSLQTPVAALVCNFTKPTQDKPSLLSHDEVETFFHEFGHCLHSILTEAEYGEFSGTAVARDFVEAPSQMFEHWVWDRDVLNTFARHYKTGEPLPQDLLEGMIRAQYLASGIKAERQIYYGMVDMAFHTNAAGDVNTTKIGLDLADDVEVYDAVPGTYFHAAFGHLTGYQAGYYGYLWSLVYAEDMFQRFREQGLLNSDAGRYYREKILSRGGTIDEMEMVRDYLGREPRMEPFLRHLGLEAAGPDAE